MRSIAAAAWRLFMRRPVDSAAILVAVTASLAILINALYLQSGRHPAPMMRAQKSTTVSTAPLKRAPVMQVNVDGLEPLIPRPRPAALAPTPSTPRATPELITSIQKELARRGFYDAVPDGIWGPKTDAAVRDFAQRASVRVPAEPGEPLLRLIERSAVKAAAATPPTTVASVSRDTLTKSDASLPSARLMAVQRALADYGYGQIKATGFEDSQTRAAIAAFERERNLPPTGRLSDQLVRELAAMTGRPLE